MSLARSGTGCLSKRPLHASGTTSLPLKPQKELGVMISDPSLPPSLKNCVWFVWHRSVATHVSHVYPKNQATRDCSGEAPRNAKQLSRALCNCPRATSSKWSRSLCCSSCTRRFPRRGPTGTSAARWEPPSSSMRVVGMQVCSWCQLSWCFQNKWQRCQNEIDWRLGVFKLNLSKSISSGHRLSAQLGFGGSDRKVYHTMVDHDPVVARDSIFSWYVFTSLVSPKLNKKQFILAQPNVSTHVGEFQSQFLINESSRNLIVYGRSIELDTGIYNAICG